MTVTNEEIARRAYEIWEREGRPAGKEHEHWLQAEAELREEDQPRKSRGRKAGTKEPVGAARSRKTAQP